MDLRILLAWPDDWEAKYKMHAPRNITMEISAKNGEIESLSVLPENRKSDVVLKKLLTFKFQSIAYKGYYRKKTILILF